MIFGSFDGTVGMKYSCLEEPGKMKVLSKIRVPQVIRQMKELRISLIWEIIRLWIQTGFPWACEGFQ